MFSEGLGAIFCVAIDSIVCPSFFDPCIAGRTAHFLDSWTQLTQDPWVLTTISSGFKLEFITYPPFQRHAPPNATMDELQSYLCDEEVNSLIMKGAVVEAGEKMGYTVAAVSFFTCS